MSQFDFDTVIDRRGTGSLKFDFAQERGRPADVLPLWVADMDLKPRPPCWRRCAAAWTTASSATAT